LHFGEFQLHRLRQLTGGHHCTDRGNRDICSDP
jgi:hypothetical protein